MHILVHRQNGGLGDIVCMLPAIDALAAKHPGAQIDVAVPREYAELLRRRFGDAGAVPCGEAKTVTGAVGERRGSAPPARSDDCNGAKTGTGTVGEKQGLALRVTKPCFVHKSRLAGTALSRFSPVKVLACDYRKFRPRWRRIFEQRYDATIDLSAPAPATGQDASLDLAAAGPAAGPADRCSPVRTGGHLLPTSVGVMCSCERPDEHIAETCEQGPAPAERSANVPVQRSAGARAPKGRVPGLRAQPNRIDAFARICGVRLDHPVPTYRVPDGDRGWTAEWLAERGIAPGRRPVVCLHLKSARAEKDWPLDKLRELARRLDNRGVRVIGLERIQKLDTPGVVDADGLSLPRAAALIAACDALVGPDSGPMHLAAAVGVPCVALFGPTDPAVILKHYGATHRAIPADKGTAGRAPTGDIEVDEVLAAVEEVLAPAGKPAQAATTVGQNALRAEQVTETRPPEDTGRGTACRARASTEGRQSILFISDKAYPQTLGGAEISMHLLLERLREHGFETETRLWHKHAKRRVGEIIRRADPDWVFTQLRVAPDVVREAKRQGRRAAVFVRSLAGHVCGYREHGRHVCIETGERAEPLTCSLRCMRRRTNIEAQRAMFRTADLVVCNSDYVRRVIERVFGRRDLLVQHPLVREPRGAGLRRRRYLTMIRPSPGKGQAVFERLVQLLPDREFLVVGGGEPDVALGHAAHLPAAPNMGEVYRATRILLQPAANPEAFGRTVAEAAAFGVPSVVSNQGGLPEALGPGGIAVDDFENAEAWVAAIEAVERDVDAYAAKALEHAKMFRSIDALLGALRNANEGGDSRLAPTSSGSRRDKRRSLLRPLRDRPDTVRATQNASGITVMTDGFPGVQGAFRHLAAVVPFVASRHFEPDRAPPPGLCILGGWRRDYAAYVRRHYRRSHVTFALSWHSSWNQIEQSGEWCGLAKALELLRAGRIAKLFVSCEETAAVLGRMRSGVEWLPNTLDTRLAERPATEPAGRDVDLFCSACPRKNLYPQLAALAGAGATLHVNRTFPAAAHEAAAMLSVRVVRADLPERGQYVDAIGRMAAGLQVTLAESFNYVAAEHMLLGVPVLVSRHVPCKPPDERLVVDDEHSPAAIRAKLLPVLDEPALRTELAGRAREHIVNLADKHNRIAADVLRRAAA